VTSIQIIKSSGEMELFSLKKLEDSLRRSGASQPVIEETAKQVEKQLYPGISTHQIYSIAFGLLKKHRPAVASRYSLKKSILSLGPSGHPFEDLVAGVMASQGYDVKTRQTVQGRCVKHELDVIAEMEGRRVFVECKFHHEQGLKVDIKTALYVQARFEDLASIQKEADKTTTGGFNQVWLVTNAKITTDATQYARCVGLQAIGWGYPLGGSLPLLIDRAGLHPVTALTLLNKTQKEMLIEKDIILCKYLSTSNLISVGLTEKRATAVLEESKRLCQAK
jgi:hypothetical protein